MGPPSKVLGSFKRGPLKGMQGPIRGSSRLFGDYLGAHGT